MSSLVIALAQEERWVRGQRPFGCKKNFSSGRIGTPRRLGPRRRALLYGAVSLLVNNHFCHESIQFMGWGTVLEPWVLFSVRESNHAD